MKIILMMTISFCNVNVEKLKEFKLGRRYVIDLVGDEAQKLNDRTRFYQTRVGNKIIDIAMYSSQEDFISYEDDVKEIEKTLIERYG